MDINPLMDLNDLTNGERGYLLGLYLSDGCLQKRSKRSYRVTFHLQGNEGKIANRVGELLRRANMKPSVSYSKGENCIVVGASSRNLNEFFPNKDALKYDEQGRERFFDENGFHGVQNGVPFCAGLLDGDGTCRAYCYQWRHRKTAGSFGSIRVRWKFSQNKLPFLIDFLHEFLESLAPNSTCIASCFHVNTGRSERLVRFSNSGRKTLLEAGVGKWSWKAAECELKVSQLLKEKQKRKTDWIVRSKGEGERLVDVAYLVF
jgi:hypothetical protein